MCRQNEINNNIVFLKHKNYLINKKLLFLKQYRYG